jgi:hypothetical protein
MIGTSLSAYIISLALFHGLLQIIVIVFVLRDAWRNRWNEKFRGTSEDFDDLPPEKYAPTDLRAFRDTLVDDTVPNVTYRKVITTPFMIAVGLVGSFWTTYWIIALLS